MNDACIDISSFTATQTQNQVKRGLFLYVVIAERAPVFQLFAREYQALLLRRNAFLVLDLRLHILNRVAWLYVQCYCLACQCFHKATRTFAQTTTHTQEKQTFASA